MLISFSRQLFADRDAIAPDELSRLDAAISQIVGLAIPDFSPLLGGSSGDSQESLRRATEILQLCGQAGLIPHVVTVLAKVRNSFQTLDDIAKQKACSEYMLPLFSIADRVQVSSPHIQGNNASLEPLDSMRVSVLRCCLRMHETDPTKISGLISAFTRTGGISISRIKVCSYRIQV